MGFDRVQLWGFYVTQCSSVASQSSVASLENRQVGVECGGQIFLS